MPVYEFKCAKCGELFEVMGSYAEREKEHACPKCGSLEVKQPISLGDVDADLLHQSGREDASQSATHEPRVGQGRTAPPLWEIATPPGEGLVGANHDQVLVR